MYNQKDEKLVDKETAEWLGEISALGIQKENYFLTGQLKVSNVFKDKIFVKQTAIEDEEYSIIKLRRPTYLQVWLWLWQERKFIIEPIYSDDEDGWTFRMSNYCPTDCGLYDTPENAIIASIHWLRDNKFPV